MHVSICHKPDQLAVVEWTGIKWSSRVMLKLTSLVPNNDDSILRHDYAIAEVGKGYPPCCYLSVVSLRTAQRCMCCSQHRHMKASTTTKISRRESGHPSGVDPFSPSTSTSTRFKAGKNSYCIQSDQT